MGQEGKKRIHKWDLVKALLILAVVWGHFVNEYARPENGDVIMKGISILIYSFHMPLFIFLSGLMVRPWKEGKPFSWEKPVYFVLIGYLLKILIYMTKYAFGKEPVFMWLADTGIPWYMFAMAAFLVLTYLLRNVDWRLVLGLSILISYGAGYVDSIGIFLNLSRIIVFFPYYYMGYLTDPARLQEFLEDSRVKKIAVVLLLVLVAIVVIHTVPAYNWIRLLTGRNSYYRIRGWDPNMLGIARLLSYGVCSAIGLAVMSLVPDRVWSFPEKTGRATLQIYFWHRLALYILKYTGTNDWLVLHFPFLWRWIYLGIATVITVILTLDIFRFPLELVSKWQNSAIRLVKDGKKSDGLIFVAGLCVMMGMLLFVYITGYGRNCL